MLQVVALTPGDVTAPLPATMFVDYVRLYDNGYTQGCTGGLTP